MTFGDLLGAFSAQAVDHSAYMTKRYVAALGDVSAWSVTTAQLDGMAQALIAAGLKPSTVNRDLSMIGSAYRWAKARRLHPAGFRSPTLECHRYKEDIRRVEVSRSDIDRLLAVSLGSRDARFAVYLHLLVDTGARRSEVLERHWRDIDLDARTLLAPTTKTGQPRVLPKNGVERGTMPHERDPVPLGVDEGARFYPGRPRGSPPPTRCASR